MSGFWRSLPEVTADAGRNKLLLPGRTVFQGMPVDVAQLRQALHVLVVSDAGDGGDGGRSGELGQ